MLSQEQHLARALGSVGRSGRMRSAGIPHNVAFPNGVARDPAWPGRQPGGVTSSNRIRMRMNIGVDDWHFRAAESDSLVVDVFLNNGQHALMEVNPMRNPHLVNGEIPEMILFGECPGETLHEASPPARWIARPPSPQCQWSRVQLPPVLCQQIQQHLARLAGAPAG